MEFENKAVFGIYRSTRQLRNAMGRLKDSGFREHEMWVVRPYRGRTYANIPRKPTYFAHQLSTNAWNGTKIGSLLGLVIGAFAAFFIWEAFESPWSVTATILFGLIFGAASGALIGIGTPHSAIYRYLEYIGTGAKLLSVHVKDLESEQRALDILRNTNAEDISEKDEQEARNIIKSSEVIDLNLRERRKVY